MIIKPLFDRVLCEPIKERKTESGFVLQSDKPEILRVIAVGDVCKVKCGDKIIINKYAGSEFDGKVLVKEIDVIGIIVENGSKANYFQADGKEDLL
ncbi:MAG: co-chaperone GroES [Christensenellaceae bacterium]|jgi:co-chaperonin GroES (HSP10)|nr:co-chaperone GroES [Christensenellaceae bacterium]